MVKEELITVTLNKTPKNHVGDTVLVPGRRLTPEFALHRRIEEVIGTHVVCSTQGWVLTHTPTGMSVIRNIRTIKQGEDMVGQLLNKGINWSFTDIMVLPIEMRRRAKEVVEAVCRVHGVTR